MSAISGIRLYNYQGQYTIGAPLNVDESFYLSPSFFSSEYAVDTVPTNIDQTANLALNGSRGLTSADTSDYNTLANTIYSSGTNIDYNDITSRYGDHYAAMFADVTQAAEQTSYKIFDGGVGLNVQTDGNGNIESVGISPNASWDFRTGTTSDFSFSDRATTTTRAAGIINNSDSPFPQYYAPTGKTGGMPPNGAVNPQQQFIPQIVPTLFKTNTAKTVPPPVTQSLVTPTDVEANPLIQALFRLQPANNGLSLTGINSNIPPEVAKQAAAFLSGFGVDTSQIDSAFLKALSAQISDKLSTGQISMEEFAKTVAQSMPFNAATQTSPSSSPLTQSMMAGQPNTPDQQTSVSVDVQDNASSGGYMPFQSSTNSEDQQGTNRRPKNPFIIPTTS